MKFIVLNSPKPPRRRRRGVGVLPFSHLGVAGNFYLNFLFFFVFVLYRCVYNIIIITIFRIQYVQGGMKKEEKEEKLISDLQLVCRS